MKCQEKKVFRQGQVACAPNILSRFFLQILKCIYSKLDCCFVFGLLYALLMFKAIMRDMIMRTLLPKTNYIKKHVERHSVGTTSKQIIFHNLRTKQLWELSIFLLLLYKIKNSHLKYINTEKAPLLGICKHHYQSSFPLSPARLPGWPILMAPSTLQLCRNQEQQGAVSITESFFPFPLFSTDFLPRFLRYSLPTDVSPNRGLFRK